MKRLLLVPVLLLAGGCQLLFDPDVVPLPGPSGLSAGGEHTCTCAVAGGGIQCWGAGDLGQLGDGVGNSSFSPVQVSGSKELTGWNAVSAGFGHTCALGNGDVFCWGSNDSGQVGNGSTMDALVPQQVSLSRPARAIAAGGSHTCAITDGGGTWCWGANTDGQLGNNSTTDSRTPVQVAGLPGQAGAIAAGDNHTCALLDDGSVWCWGHNSSGQLGDGTTTDSLVPVQVSGLSARAVATGSAHTCAIGDGALTGEGSVWCWGSNADGQLGNNSSADSSRPVAVQNLSADAQVVATGWEHTCALVSGGSIWCWGDNSGGQLGSVSALGNRLPAQVQGLSSRAQAVTGGFQHTCALADYAVQCWGNNFQGELGTGTRTSSSSPLPVRPWKG
jgi:alpha-tubulin suppressor-like RCC1 family protein